MDKKIKVLVVDDSPVYRALLTQLISSDPQLEVVATAEDPYQARELIKQLNPDVLTLDIEMPRMNGVQFLRNLMRLRPMPVVMISTLTQHGAEATLEALDIGAVDYFPKPSLQNTADMLNYRNQINDKLKMAVGANVHTHSAVCQPAVIPASAAETDIRLIAIGASTGGTEALKQIFMALPAGLPPIVITQHISAMFTRSLAERLDACSQVEVMEVSGVKQELRPGHAYLAPGDRHLVITEQAGRLYGQLDDRPEVNRHKPSVDVMFESVAQTLGCHSLGIILTGMGQDGARGILSMRQAGAATLAQDQFSSVVWGMPRVAVELGTVQRVEPLANIPQWICKTLFHPHGRREAL